MGCKKATFGRRQADVTRVCTSMLLPPTIIIISVAIIIVIVAIIVIIITMRRYKLGSEEANNSIEPKWCVGGRVFVTVALQTPRYIAVAHLSKHLRHPQSQHWHGLLIITTIIITTTITQNTSKHSNTSTPKPNIQSNPIQTLQTHNIGKAFLSPPSSSSCWHQSPPWPHHHQKKPVFIPTYLAASLRATL